MPIADPIKRREYFKAYRESGKQAVSEAKRLANMHNRLCLCGRPGWIVKEKQAVCRRCAEIEAEIYGWEDAKLRDVLR